MNSDRQNSSETFKERLNKRFGSTTTSCMPSTIPNQSYGESASTSASFSTKSSHSNQQAPPRKKDNDSSNTGRKLLDIIKNYNSNFIGILNETSLKARTSVAYSFKDSFAGQSTQFGCECLFGGKNIGLGSGTTKQAAKAQSAENGALTLLTSSDYASERAILIQTYQNCTDFICFVLIRQVPGFREVMSEVRATSGSSNAYENQSDPSSFNEYIKNSDSFNYYSNNFMGGSALYELNYLAKECFIEPRWGDFSINGPNGGFQIKLVFDQLTTIGDGRKKNDAKQDAALKILNQIRGNKHLSEKYDPKARRDKRVYYDEPKEEEEKVEREISVSDRLEVDSREALFRSVIPPVLYNNTKKELENWINSISEVENTFASYITSSISCLEIEEVVEQALQLLYEIIADYLTTICAKPRQILSGTNEHVSDYINYHSLIPIGSFGLKCVREDNQCIDAVFCYKKNKSVDDKYLLNLLEKFLSECEKLCQKHLSVCLKTFNNQECILISMDHQVGELKMILRLNSISDQEFDAQNETLNAITHITRIYCCFKAEDDLTEFRNLMMLLRSWRAKNNLSLIPPEILDVILLNEYLNNKYQNAAGYIINCFTVMSSDVSVNGIIKKFGTPYTTQYQSTSLKSKNDLFTKSSESLRALYNKRYSDILLR